MGYLQPERPNFATAPGHFYNDGCNPATIGHFAPRPTTS